MIVPEVEPLRDLPAHAFSDIIQALRDGHRPRHVTKGYRMPDHLTPVQRSVLLVLMAEAREVPNVDLTKVWKLKLEQKPRENLRKLELITVRTESRRLHLDLTGKGSQWCQDQLAAEPPAGMGHAGAAAYALLAAIRRHLERTGGSLTAFVARGDEPSATEPEQVTTAPVDLQTLIRKTYRELATRPGDWVKLSTLRPLLDGADRAAIDNALIALNRARDVSIEPESDQKTLTDQDWEAAVLIGNEPKHVIAIGQS
jgi:hypothetical protein